MRTLGLLWRLGSGYRVAPWRSPYLLWRIETYWGLHADRIGFSEFWRFVWLHRSELLRYLKWAGEQELAVTKPSAVPGL